MQDQERPRDRIVRLMREAIDRDTPQQSDAPRIIVQGGGNILGNVHGDVVTVHHARPRTLTRADRRVLRASAINYIRATCRRLDEPSRYRNFAIDEFGVADLELLDETQLERIRGWCAAQLR